MKRIFYFIAFTFVSLTGFSQQEFEGITGLKFLGTDTIQVEHDFIWENDTIQKDSIVYVDVQTGKMRVKYINGTYSDWYYSGVSSSTDWNYNVQPLSGISPIYNILSGIDATITISGNTSVYMQNLTDGATGTLYITNPSTVYKIKFIGYILDIANNLTYDSGGITLQGSSLRQSIGWKYINSKMLIHSTYYTTTTY